MNNQTKKQSSAFSIKESPVENFRKLRVVVIGAGFSGIYAAIRIPERLRNIELTVYEKNSGVGGTWFENRYPGCACDIPAHSYQYSFHPNIDWSTFYAPAKEICDYLESVAKRYSATRFIKFKHRVKRCDYDLSQRKWKLEIEDIDQKKTFQHVSDVVISARGALNEKAWPEIDGLDSFKGKLLHSASWDQTYDFAHKRIGVIGSGSSAIQIVPSLQKVKGTQLSCFIRSKTWISPQFGAPTMNRLGIETEEFSETERERMRNNPQAYAEFRKNVEADGNAVHALTLKDSKFQEGARARFGEMMRERLSKKPEIAEKIIPSFAAGCRRLTPGPGYLEALTEDNVDFISTPLARVLENGVELSDGTRIELDALVCATGFHSTAPPPFPVVGFEGRALQEHFKPYPETYMGITTDFFPNFFMMLGPNSAIGTGSLTMMIEAGGDYIVKCIRKIQKEDIVSMTPKTARVRNFSAYIDEYFKKTIYLDDCKSWYKNDGGRGRRIVALWPGSTLHAIETLRSPRWEDFEYVYKDENPLRWLGNGWSTHQQEENGDTAYYLEPELLDIPENPLPEKTHYYNKRPFSH